MSEDVRLINTAKEAIAREDFAHAVKILKDIVIYSPEGYEGYMLLGACLGRTGRITEGMRAMNQAASLNPHSAQVQYNFGKLLYQAGELEDSIERLNAAIHIDPGYDKARKLLHEVRALVGGKSPGWSAAHQPPPSRVTALKRGVPVQSEKNGWRGTAIFLCITLAVCAGVGLPVLLKKNAVEPVAKTKAATTAASHDEHKVWSKHPEYGKSKKPARVKASQAPKSYRGKNLNGRDFSGQDLGGVNFAGSSLVGANFANSDLERADFRGANLRGADFSGAQLSRARFDDADLHGDSNAADFTNAVMPGSSLRGADLRGVRFENTDLSNAVMSNCDLRGANLAGANLSGATLASVDLDDATLDSANVEGADFRGSGGIGEASMNGVNASDATLWPEGFKLEQ